MWQDQFCYALLEGRSVTAEQVEDKGGGYLVQGLSKAYFCIGRRGRLESALTFANLEKTGCKY